MSENRETLGSRLGFLFLSAGCAIGLGNVWRFPYITGKYGGAAFVLLYLLFLVMFGLPIMVMEFAVGRASRKGMGGAFKALEPKGTHWHYHNFFAIAGNYLLMMFYTVIGGWMISYFIAFVRGDFQNLDPQGVATYFETLTTPPNGAFPFRMVFWMFIVIAIGFSVCALGLQNGVERITKVMMSGLLFILIALAIYVAFLPGSSKGYAFYLKPDFHKMAENGIFETIYAAMGQAFFTLSLGIGAMGIFGSYIDKKYSLSGESIRIIILDTFVAICSGLIIFPACFAKGVSPSEGPGLVFLSLPNVFNGMKIGRVVGSLFFLFMSFAALTTVIAVFENITAYWMDYKGWSRKKSVLMNFVLVTILSLPCALGMNVWSGIRFGIIGSIDSFEDFLVSNNLLPLGSLVYLMFCVSKKGWGWDNFIKEADTGEGIKFPNNKFIRAYLKYVVPVVILIIFVLGYIDIFRK